MKKAGNLIIIGFFYAMMQKSFSNFINFINFAINLQSTSINLFKKSCKNMCIFVMKYIEGYQIM